LGETVKVRRQFGAMMVVTRDTLNLAVADVERIVSETLQRQLREAGADELRPVERQPGGYWVDEPRSWWQKLLRRAPHQRWVPMIEYRMTGFGWVDGPEDVAP
jgi:hypothetical protein